MTFIPPSFEDPILDDNRGSYFAKVQADQKYSQGNWANVANLLSQWGDQAPTLPGGSVVGLAHAGIGPDHPIGQQIISNVVPQQMTAYTATLNDPPPPTEPQPFGPPPTYSRARAIYQNEIRNSPVNVQEGRRLSEPRAQAIEQHEQTTSLPEGTAPKPQGLLGEAVHAVGHVVHDVQNDVLAPVGRVLKPAIDPTHPLGLEAAIGTPGVTSGNQGQSQAASLPTLGALKATTRELGAVANVGTTALAVVPKQEVADIAYLRGHPEGMDIGLPGGGVLHAGPAGQTLVSTPEQFQLYQQLTGKSLGSGILPGGPASEAAVQAQRAAANINGHALTFGRGLASAAFAPGSLPYNIVSGITDFGIAEELDPAAALLKEFASERELGKTFTAVPDDAYKFAADHLIANANTSDQVNLLRDWSGASVADTPDLRDAIINRLGVNPDWSDLTTGVDKITTDRALLKSIGMNSLGATSYMRRQVNAPNALTFLNSSRGNALADNLADDNSFTSIWHKLGKQVPVNLVSAMQRTTDPTDIKFMLASELGTTVQKVPGFQWLRPLEDIRALHGIPGVADLSDRSQMVEQAERHLIAMNVPKDQWDSVLQPIADSVDSVDIKKAYMDGVAGAGAKNLVENYGVDPTHARDITRFITDREGDAEQFTADQIGNVPHLPGVVIDGEMVPVIGPFDTSQLLNRTIPALDYRAMVQASTRLRAVLHIWDNQGTIGGGLQGLSNVMDSVTHFWKGTHLLHPATLIRYLADEQMGLASTGLDSAAHPLRLAAWTVAKDHHIPFSGNYAEDLIDKDGNLIREAGTPKTVQLPSPEKIGYTNIAGNDWNNDLNDTRSAIVQANGFSTLSNKLNQDTGKILLKNIVKYNHGEPEYKNAYARSLSLLASSPVSRELAKAIRDPNYEINPAHLPQLEGEAADAAGPIAARGIDNIKQEFWDGSLSKERETLVRADLKWGSKYMDPTVDRTLGTSGARAFSDAYIDQKVNELKTLVAGGPNKPADAELLNAVADGTPFGVPGQINSAFRKSLYDKVDAGFGPATVRGQLAVTPERKKGLNAAMDFLFGKLMDNPSKELMRSPAFKQSYWRKAQNLLPFMSQDAQAEALANARKVGIELSPVTQAGTLDIDSADTILKAHALEQVKKLVYYPGERVGITDRLRNIAPFADAWRRIIARWASLSVQHPQILRRAQQGVTSLQSSGFFHPDPAQGGLDVFTVVPGSVTKALGAGGLPITSPVKSLNLVGQGLPGLGPATQMAIAPLLNKITSPSMDWVKSLLAPYGNPDPNIIESFFPGYADKLRAAGTLTPWGGFGLPATQTEQYTVTNLAKDMLSYKISTGAVNFHNQDSMQAGWDSALSQAKRMYGIMGLAQFAAPVNPAVTRNIQLKDGSVVEGYLLAQDYYKMITAHNGDTYAATTEFVKKYGAARIFSTVSKSQRLIYGISTGAESQAFTAANHGFAEKFPQVYGYWAPVAAQNQRGSYDDWLKGHANGIYAPLSGMDWTRIGEARLGNTAYNQARQLIGPSPTAPERQFLDTTKQNLAQQYPGFGVDVGQAKLNTQQMILQVQNAVDNKDVPQGDLTNAARSYLQARSQILAGIKATTGLKSLSSTKNATVIQAKDLLFSIGTDLANRVPEFTTMWNDIFQYEVDQNGG